MFNKGVRGLGFFGLLNADADGLDSKWYGTVLLEPINGGDVPSNFTTDYQVSLTSANLFDKEPDSKMTLTSIKLNQKAVQGIPTDWPRANTKWNCFVYHQE